MLAGVAGGIAEYFDLDPWIIRIAMVVLAFVTGGTAVLLYAGAWLVLPAGASSASTVVAETSGVAGEQPKRRQRRSAAPGLVWGLLLIVAGALLLARQADVSLPPVEGVLAAGLIVVWLAAAVRGAARAE